ncbi:MAG TPA: hypothetical protein VEH55_00200 [Gaiellaceae bacterium]|jgi:hypothetical protein|nr:hypothetical protein [Gaiellaceae bacterium]
MDGDRPALLERELVPAPAQGAPHASDQVVCTADLADCTCPEFCERDHTNE